MSSRCTSKRAGRSATKSLGAWLRQLRLARKLPLRRVAAAADMDTAHLSKIELGHRLPTETQTKALAAFFKLPIDDLASKRIAEKFLLEHQNSDGVARAAALIKDAVKPNQAKKEMR